MRVYYGQGGAGANRFSEKYRQLRVRQRLIHTIRALLAAYEPGWRNLPRGQKDLSILRPRGGMH